MSNVYPLALAAGTLASFLWIGLTTPPSRSTTGVYNQRGLDAALWAALFGLAGARTGYVLLHWNYYKLNLQEVSWFWDGGLSWIGGVLGVLPAIAIFTAANKHRFWPLADQISVAAPILGFACWFGCLIDSCAYGKPASFGFFTPHLSDIFGFETNRWPVQGTGAILNLLILLLLINLRRRHQPEGVRFATSMTLVSVSNLFLYFFRGDSIRLINGLRLDALATIPILVGSVVLLIILLKRSVNSVNSAQKSNQKE